MWVVISPLVCPCPFTLNNPEHSLTHFLVRTQSTHHLIVTLSRLLFLYTSYPPTAACFGVNACAEANLDVQYMMSTAQYTPTTYWYSR